MDTTLTTSHAVTLAPHGAEITEDLSLEEWIHTLKQYKLAKDFYLNNVSSLLRYGRKKFGGETVGKTLEQLEFDLADGTRALAISDLSETFKQTHQLTAEHNYLLSLLKTDQEREKWATLTTSNKLTPVELKKSIEAGQVITQQQIDDKLGKGAGILTIQGVVFKYEQWVKANGGKKKILSLPKDSRQKLLEEISPLIELAAEIDESLETETNP